MRGVSLLIDETAQEEAAVFLPQSNCVGGLCWTHANLVDVSLNNYQSALNIAAALKSGKVHLGKEITVVGAHIFGEEGLYPILAAPTCKSEGAPEMEFILNTIIEAWSSSDAANRVGPVWSVATDGDATRRKAGHKTFVWTPLTVTSPLYGILSNLPGLNLLTGDQAFMLDFYYKHIYKWISTLMCSRSGMFLNNGRCINMSMLQHYLVWIDGIDEARAQKLLYPDDPQDVPRAVELMSAVIKLAAVDPTKPPFTPLGAQASVDLIADFDAIRLLGTLIHHILNLFINASLSLSEQVVHLSCFSHLLYACYRSQRRALMPNQLYYDMQTLTKNAIFCIAKQQKLDASASFSLLDLGDDVLELQFAFLRMCGGHNSVVTYRQALDHLGAARDIGGVYARNPDLTHGHWCLNLKCADGVDHISSSMWVGDMVTGHCDLPHSWCEGRDKAIDILKHSQISCSCYEFNTLFAHNSGMDLLCVFGEGKYPSVDDNDEEDRSLLMQVPQDVHHDILTTDSVQQSNAAAEDQGNDEEDTVTFEELVDQELDPTHVDNPALDDDEPEYNSNVEPSASAPPKGPGIHPQDYVWCKKKWVHKQSICRLIITPNFTPKSQVQLLRVRGFTSVNKKVNDAEVGNVLCGSYFITGDLFITLMRTPNKIMTLALVRATVISENGVPRARINSATLTSPRSNVKVTGEVLIILPSTSNHPMTDSSLQWIWNGSYLKHVSPVPGTDRTTLKVFTVSIAGHLLKTINPTIIDAFEHLTHDQAAEVNSKGTTWALSEDALHLAILLLWKEIMDSNTPVNVLPVLSFESAHFPYCAHNGSVALVCNAGTELLMASGRGSSLAYGHSHSPHVSNIPEVLINQLGGKLPCGFCGQSDNPDCAVTIKKTARKTEVECKCPHKESYQYGSANKGSDNRPCRNVPIVCKLCVHKNRDTDWRYNFEAHIDQEHLNMPTQPGPMVVISQERKAGVPLRPPFLLVVEKENAPLASGSSRIQKRKSDGQTFASAASLVKRVRLGH
ncbi:hypothetical protein DEU56DRAFT_915172 [Suillus clintonianus]|uniref:uncharacterized protein n=1 Tax=Suillus clintonianus TaxID=1904413 RepID=UPI001B87227A|nr:uncharacterized protein DEU56DRAFT_915172 [Suillus clintonianus]KAG2129459.1 hypothetical protein DEU56DRAFT_915172 [Suillus clintonianus]